MEAHSENMIVMATREDFCSYTPKTKGGTPPTQS